MKLAFIGASHWHLPLYLDPALEIDGVEIVGISDPDAACVEALSARLSCTGDTDFRALCRSCHPSANLLEGHPSAVGERPPRQSGIPFAPRTCNLA